MKAVLVGATRLDLSTVDPLATGGEASVYAVGHRALKIWHAPTAARASKIDALLARRSALPALVVAPEERAVDAADGSTVGFAMPLMPPTFEPLAMLARAPQRAARGITLRTALEVLRHLVEALGALHRAGIVVGDLSDQNVAVDPASSDPLRLLDVDSFQIDGLPCEVATEAFLDPHLYGPDPARPCVTAGGRARTFTAESDGYAFAVLLFRVLYGVHPYGGALDALPTLPRRAAARASVLRAEVKAPPRVREAIDALGPAMRARFEAIFERGERCSFSAADLSTLAASIVSCGCGLEIAVSALPCPRCSRLASRPTIATTDRVRVAVVIEAAGPVVAVAASGDGVLAVAIEAGRPCLYVARAGRVDRFALARDAGRAGWDVALGSHVVLVAPRGAEPVAPVSIAVLGRGGLAEAATVTERVRGCAAMAVAGDAYFRVARGTVLAGNAARGDATERPVATVMPHATRLFGATFEGNPAAILVGAAMGIPRWEVATVRGAVTLEAPALAPGETIREVAAYGDGAATVVLARTFLAGRSLVRTAFFDAGGRCTRERVVPQDRRAADDVLGGGACRGGAVVLATPAGLVREDASDVERRFPETAPFTAASAPVALAPGGVFVADGTVVRRLQLS